MSERSERGLSGPAALVERGPLRAALAGVVVAVLLVAVLAALVGEGDDGAPMSAADAATFTERALDEAGVPEADVGRPEEGKFGIGPLAQDVWIVPADVSGQRIALSVDADGDSALNLADELADGTNVLDEDQFDALARFRFDPTSEDRTLASGVAVGAAIVVAVALGLASRRSVLPSL